MGGVLKTPMRPHIQRPQACLSLQFWLLMVQKAGKGILKREGIPEERA